jgi:hypothetical protein
MRETVRMREHPQFLHLKFSFYLPLTLTVPFAERHGCDPLWKRSAARSAS